MTPPTAARVYVLLRLEQATPLGFDAAPLRALPPDLDDAGPPRGRFRR